MVSYSEINGLSANHLFFVDTTLNSQVDHLIINYSDVSGLPTMEKLVRSLPESRADILRFGRRLGKWLADGHPWAWDKQCSFLIEHHEVKVAHVIAPFGEDYAQERKLQYMVRNELASRHPGLQIELYYEVEEAMGKRCRLYKQKTDGSDSLPKRWDSIHVADIPSVGEDQTVDDLALFLGCVDSRLALANLRIIREMKAKRKEVLLIAGSVDQIASGEKPITSFFYDLVWQSNKLTTAIHEYCGALSHHGFQSCVDELMHQLRTVAKVATNCKDMTNGQVEMQLLHQQFMGTGDQTVTLGVSELIPQEAVVAA